MNVKVDVIEQLDEDVTCIHCDLTDMSKNIIDVAMETVKENTDYNEYKELAQKVLDGELSFEDFSKESGIAFCVDVNYVENNDFVPEEHGFYCVEETALGVENDGIFIVSCEEQEKWYLPVKFSNEDKKTLFDCCEKEYNDFLKSTNGKPNFGSNVVYVKEGSDEYERD